MRVLSVCLCTKTNVTISNTYWGTKCIIIPSVIIIERLRAVKTPQSVQLYDGCTYYSDYHKFQQNPPENIF